METQTQTETETERLQSLTTRLYEAALQGDVASLHNLLQDDPFILDRCMIEKSSRFMHSPLHVAANLGHLEFTQEILSRKPELAEQLDQSKRWSPLHMAAAKGHLETVNALLVVNPKMCFVRDVDGRNPAHVAALNDQIQVLELILRTKPQAVRERTSDGDSILHLCLKHNQLQTLMFLLQSMDDGLLLNSKDFDGNTILHLAVAAKHYEIIQFLLKNKRIEKNAINTNGLTAMDTCIQTRKYARDGEIWFTLKHAKVRKAKDLLKPRNSNRNWLERQSAALMVVASLIATMAFQAGINPPGGVWQDDSNGHKAGTSIMAHVRNKQKDREIYDAFLVTNTVGLVSSLTVIILLISGLPCQKLFMGLLMVTMWIAATATIMTYTLSVYFLINSPDQALITSAKDLVLSKNPVQRIITYASGIWVILLGILVFGHVLRLVAKMINQLISLPRPRTRYYPPV